MSKRSEQIKKGRLSKRNAWPDYDSNPEFYRQLYYSGWFVGKALPSPKKPEPKVTNEDVAKAIRTYIQPLDCIVEKNYVAIYNNLIGQILANHTVIKYLRKARRKKGEEQLFNKWSVFKFIGYLRIIHIYTNDGNEDSNRDIEKKLEDHSRGYHTKIGQPLPPGVEDAIKDIVNLFRIK